MALTDNLVAYYKLDSNSNDSVGSNNGVDTSVSYVTGKVGNGASYNGTSSRTLISSNLGIGNSTCSIQTWVKLNSEIASGVYNIVAVQDQTTQVGYGINYEYNAGTRRVGLFRNKNNVTPNSVYSTGSLGTTNWNHFIVTYNGTNVEGYVNGVSIGTVASSGNGIATGYTNVTNIGYVLFSGSNLQFTNAVIDEVGVWNRAITSSEVSQLYNSGNGLTYPFSSSSNNGAGFLLFFNS